MASRFQQFRRTRPFWGGLFTLLAGVWILSLPLSPIADMVLLGVAGISGALIGIVLAVLGLFVWFSPPNRSLAGVLTLICALASFVVSNLGGLIVGMVLGLVGGALTLAWAPDGGRPAWWDRRRGGPPGGAAALLVIGLGVLPMLLLSSGRAEARELPHHPVAQNLPHHPVAQDLPTPPLPIPVPIPTPPTLPLPQPLPGLTGLIPPGLLAPLQPPVAPAGGILVSGLVGDLRMDTLTVTNFQYQGIVTYPVAGGRSQRALHIVVDSTDIGNLHITIPGPLSTKVVTQRPGSGHAATTRLVLDCTRLRVTIAGLLTIEFTLDFPPPPLIIIPVLPVTDVQIDYVRLATPDLRIPGLLENTAPPSGLRVGVTGTPPAPTSAQAQLLTELASLLHLPALLRPYGMSDAQARAATSRSVAPAGPAPQLPTISRPAPDDRDSDAPAGDDALLGLFGVQRSR